ncbi:MAG: FkbM family methyltransferase [Okeania sp. SIO3I5]|uniref:FkbM family methyltransferase n=1 Tax=Okeania sp. SIO3I5 TaxID=2607805 RepID=UPI0013BA5BC4|nr:FkbM family methyltransferase [Okeania sp. SIO3I5]NEQ35203.1 FkbM family methyltransferase [Okeania sp. SIO3I5]
MINFNYLETSGWLKSLTEGKSIDYNYNPLPWYSYPAIEFIEDKLKSDFRVFEYGSGQSTLWYAQRVKEVISVEHNPDYFLKIKSYTPENVILSLLEDREKYAAEINKYNDGYFDIIAIDGINRVGCAEVCYRKLTANGLIIFDNSAREENDVALEFLQEKKFKRLDFYGLLPTQKYKICTSIFLQNEEVFNRGSLPSKKKYCLGISLGQGEAITKRQNQNQGSHNNQILACYEAIKSQPYAADAYQRLGDIYYSQGQIEKSIRSYQKAIELQPDLARVYARLGGIYSQKGKLEQAIAYYQKVIKFEPSLAATYWSISEILQQQGRLFEANVYQLKALEIKPDITTKYYALNKLDLKLTPYLTWEYGFFVEVGANDGIRQSNSLYFEKYKNWQGILIEAIPDLAEKCRINRSKSVVENYALVPFDYGLDYIKIYYCNLMSFVDGAMKSEEEKKVHLERGCQVQNINHSYEINVRATTLTAILDKHGVKNIDLFSLDVEGFELDVLQGIDFDKYQPKFMLIEVRYADRKAVDSFLKPLYEPIAALSNSINETLPERSYQDILYKKAG